MMIERQRRYVHPGQIVVARMPTAVTTILGSCVAVCLWDAQRGIGGMNHFMLPLLAGSSVQSARFGNVAMEQLLAQMGDAGSNLHFLRARVFGGSCMFPGMQSPSHLGHQNVEVALEFLGHRGVEIVQVEVGGNRGRKVLFHTDEGTAWATTI